MKIILRKNHLLEYFIIIMPLVDLVLGEVLNSGADSILSKLGQFYRTLLLLYLLYIICIKNKFRNGKWLLFFSVYLLGLTINYYFRFGSDIIENFSYCLKLLLPMYLVYGVYFYRKTNPEMIEKIYNFFSWIYPLCMIIPRIIGIGYYNYSSNSGYKGLFYANNELNVILMILFVYSFDLIYKDISAKNISRVLLCLFSMLMIGSKTSFLAIFIVILCYFFRGRNKRQLLSYIIYALIGSIAVVIIAWFLLGEQIRASFLRIVFFYERYANKKNGLLTFLCTERNLRIEPGFEKWILNDKRGIENLLFGVGKLEKCPDNSVFVSPYALIEMDGFDLLFWFGLLSVLAVFIFYFGIFIKSIKLKNLFREKIFFILIFCFSMIAGHVLMSANAAMMFGLVLADIYIKEKNESISEPISFYNIRRNTKIRNI